MAGPVPSIAGGASRRRGGFVDSCCRGTVSGKRSRSLPSAVARRLTRYRRRCGAADEAAGSGGSGRRNARYARETDGLAGGCGRQRRRRCNARPGADGGGGGAYWERCTAPMQPGGRRARLTTAPDLAALGSKIAAMREQQLPDLTRMRRGLLRLLEEVMCGGFRSLGGQLRNCPHRWVAEGTVT